MTQMFFDDLEHRRGRIEQVNENSGRMAEAFARFRSVGQGSIEFPDRVDFGLTFIEEPYMSFGSFVDTDALDELLGDTSGNLPPQLPLCSGYVTDWDRDDRGFYVGAWVGVRVWFPYEAGVWPDAEVEMFHHYTFKAVAIKDVPLPDAKND